jgi:hypothetical protein
LSFGQFREAGKTGGGAAESAGNVQQVARLCAGAKQRAATGNGADEDNVGHGYRRFGQVAASQRRLVKLGQGQQAIEESLNPGGIAGRRNGQLARQAQGKKGCYGTRAHGRQVAQAARQSPVANNFRLVPVEAEVAAGNRQICRHGQFLATARGQQCAIVANAQAQSAQGGGPCPLSNLTEQGKLAFSALGSGMGLFYPHPMRIG